MIEKYVITEQTTKSQNVEGNFSMNKGNYVEGTNHADRQFKFY